MYYSNVQLLHSTVRMCATYERLQNNLDILKHRIGPAVVGRDEKRSKNGCRQRRRASTIEKLQFSTSGC